MNAHKRSHHRYTETFRHSLRDGFNGFLRALSGDRACLSPSPARCASTRQLDASVEASGPHDFAVRDRRTRLSRQPRPPHPAPNVRDDRDTPLFSRRDAQTVKCFGRIGQARRVRQIGTTGNFCMAGIGAHMPLDRCSSPWPGLSRTSFLRDRLLEIVSSESLGDASLRAKRSNLVWIASSLALLAMTSLRPPETMTAEDQTRVS
jgi:hypothetical protein